MKLGDYDLGLDQKNAEYIIREIKFLLTSAKVYCHDGTERTKQDLFKLSRKLSAQQRFVSSSRFGDDYILSDRYRSERFEQLTDDLALIVKNIINNVIRILKSKNATGKPKKIIGQQVSEGSPDSDR